MKFLFIVQGEGRGHLTQAITLEDMLQRNGHEVVEVLVGKSSSRTLPGFFNRSIRKDNRLPFIRPCKLIALLSIIHDLRIDLLH